MELQGAVTCSAFVTGGPGWLFELMLGGGAVALLYGLSWLSLILSQGRVPTRQPRWRLLPGVLGLGLSAVSLSLTLPAVLADQPRTTVVVLTGAVAAAVPVIATLRSMARRAALTGMFPAARSAPWGMFWVFLVVTVLGLAVSVSAGTAMVALGHSTRAHGQVCLDG
jgi:uncharacterized membrane protein